MTTHGLHARGLCSGYGETVILNGVSLTLEPSGSLAILGRNGVGKTTLLATLMGLTTLHAGSIVFGQHNLSHAPPYKRARAGFGYVPQDRRIFKSLTVEENLTVAQQTGDWTLTGVYELFPSLHVRRRNLGHQLSGGEQQMVAIARALMGNPRVLLMDEPLEGLAPRVVEEVLAAIQRIVRESSVALILVEQHARIALAATHDAMILERGTVVYTGPSKTLLDTPDRLNELMGLGATSRQR